MLSAGSKMKCDVTPCAGAARWLTNRTGASFRHCEIFRHAVIISLGMLSLLSGVPATWAQPSPAADSPRARPDRDSAPTPAATTETDLAHRAPWWFDDAYFAIADRALGVQDALDASIGDLSREIAVSVERRFALRLFAPSLPSEMTPAPQASALRIPHDKLWRPIAGAAALPGRVVLLVHGLDEPGSIWNDLAPALAGAGHVVIRFDYPNDQPIARSADLLEVALERLKARGVGHIDLVAHSMGGLVARDVLTRKQFYAGHTRRPADALRPTVDRFIMVGAPNYGAPMARLRFIAEIREQLMRWFDPGSDDPISALGFIADGAGQAGRDLAVGSDYLRGLNSRPLPAPVRITCIVGQIAPDDDDLLGDMLDTPIARRLFGERAARSARGLRALFNELGDGVVPVASARLAGVKDVVLVHAAHRTMLLTLGVERLLSPITGEPPAAPPAIAIILDRLKSE